MDKFLMNKSFWIEAIKGDEVLSEQFKELMENPRLLEQLERKERAEVLDDEQKTKEAWIKAIDLPEDHQMLYVIQVIADFLISPDERHEELPEDGECIELLRRIFKLPSASRKIILRDLALFEQFTTRMTKS